MNGTHPLAQIGGRPCLFGVLGAIFHLEILRPMDEEGLSRANDIVRSWIGEQLQWCHAGMYDRISRVRDADFDYITEFPAQLWEPKKSGNDEIERFAESRLSVLFHEL